jgi:hypothetical protein
MTGDAMPYLAREIELYYKAKEPRDKNDIDFAATRPILSYEQRAWLARSIEVSFGAGIRGSRRCAERMRL